MAKLFLCAQRLQWSASLSRPWNRTICVAARLGKSDDGGKKAKRSGIKETKSFALNMFTGNVVVEQVLPYPQVLSEEQLQTLDMFLGPVKKFFAEQTNPAKNDEQSKLTDEDLKALKEMGAFGIQVPEEYGGLGLTNSQYARLAEVVGQNDLGIGVTLGAHQSIGFKGILLFGNPEQKKKYLPKLASGEWVAAFALTEPGTGSDAGSIKTRAELSPDGKHFILNGSKIWISNGGLAEVFTVFAKTPVKSKKSGEMRDRVTAFIVERKFGGVTNGPPEKKMGIKCSNTTEVYFENTKIPVENVLGQVGEGFKICMNILNNGRFGMAASLTGTMRTCIIKAVEHANQRVQFGKLIKEFGAMKEKIAHMAICHYAAESIAYMISSNMDRGASEYQIEAAISKIFVSEAVWYVADEAIQILGGMGFMRETGLERIVRDIRIFRIFEGTNDILRLFIALTGMQHAGSHLKELQRALNNPIGNFGIILDGGLVRMRRMAGLSTEQDISSLVHPELFIQSHRVTRSVEMFAYNVDYMLMTYGKGVIDDQFRLNRIANAAIDIFAMMCVVSRASRSLQNNTPTAHHERSIARVFCNEAARRVRINMNAIRSPRHDRNYRLMTKIANEVCENGNLVHPHILGV